MRFGPRGAFCSPSGRNIASQPQRSPRGSTVLWGCIDLGAHLARLLAWCCNACGAQKGEQLLGQTFRLGLVVRDPWRPVVCC